MTPSRARGPSQPARGGTTRFEGGLVEIGHDGAGFAFDNEGPRHRVWLEPFALANDLVTNGRLARLHRRTAATRRPELWLSDGWATVKAEGWTAPLYWRREDGELDRHGPDGPRAGRSGRARPPHQLLRGRRLRPLGRQAPADRGRVGARRAPPPRRLLQRCSARSGNGPPAPMPPIRGFRPTEGTASEYNGKFMANQMVLRGVSLRHARRAMRGPPTATSSIRISAGPSWACDWPRTLRRR